MTPADAATLPAPTDPALATRLALMREIADRAEPICLEHYQSPSLRVERKPDGSVVTPADKDTEQMARELIHQHFPQDHITGEEFPQHEGSSDYRWIIDPIDGTDSYTRGIHTFANLIAVAEDNTPVLGLANFPALGERLTAATGHGCTWTAPHHPPKPAAVSTEPSTENAVIELTRPKTFANKSLKHLFDELALATAKTRGWSDAYAFALVATGRIDAAIALRMNIWDVAPFQPIITEAGGTITEWDGTTPITGASTLATNNALHEPLQRIINNAEEQTP